MTERNERNELTVVDLTREVPINNGLSAADWAAMIVGGGIGFLLKKGFEHFFPGTPSLREQTSTLLKLIDAGRQSGVKKMKFKMSSGADLSVIPGNTTYKLSHNANNTIEFDIEFA